MIRFLKAYKVAHPSLVERDADVFADRFYHDIIHGKSQKEALKEYCSNGEDHPYWDLKKTARTRRCKEEDLYCVPQSELLNGLADERLSHLTHSLGVSVNDPCPDKFYRNYSFYYNENEAWKELIERGLATVVPSPRGEGYVYSVTKEGICAVKSLLLLTKRQVQETARELLQIEYEKIKEETQNDRFVDPVLMRRKEEILTILMEGGKIDSFTINELKTNARGDRARK